MEREKKTNPTEKMAWNDDGLKTVGFGFSYKITNKKFTTSYRYITILKWKKKRYTLLAVSYSLLRLNAWKINLQ